MPGIKLDVLYWMDDQERVQESTRVGVNHGDRKQKSATAKSQNSMPACIVGLATSLVDRRSIDACRKKERSPHAFRRAGQPEEGNHSEGDEGDDEAGGKEETHERYLKK